VRSSEFDDSTRNFRVEEPSQVDAIVADVLRSL
jgi:hypothetical protein